LLYLFVGVVVFVVVVVVVIIIIIIIIIHIYESGILWENFFSQRIFDLNNCII